MINNPLLPPKKGYVEVETGDGGRTYKNVETGMLIEQENSLENLKLGKISQSKQDLAIFLENNPILWKDGKYYGVTQEKQSLLTSNIATYQIEVQSNPSAIITWNASGEECVQWDINELCKLAVAIKDYVKPMVTYQQEKEIEINNAQTVEDLNDIDINYPSIAVQPQYE